MIWYLIKYNSQDFWTLISTETSYSSAEARLEFLDKKVPNVNYMIVSSPLGKQYLKHVVEYKLNQLKTQNAA